MVRTTLEVTDSPGDFELRLSELLIVSRVEGARHTPVKQGLNHLGLQQVNLQAEPAFNRRTFRVNQAVVIWYSSGPNRF